LSEIEHTRRRRRRTVATLFVVMASALAGVGALSASAQGPSGDADTVFVNGRVMLYGDTSTPRAIMSSEINWAQALAVEDGLISYVGDDKGVQDQIGPDTEVVDLQNKMLMPGLGDGHMHGGPSADCNMGYEGGTIEDVLGKLKACLLRGDQVAHLKSNFVLNADLLQGEGLQPPGTRLDRHVLDRLSADPADDPFGTGTTRPIVVGNMDAHKSYTNTQAIVNGGLDENTPDPPDGFIGRDPDGYPNGQFSDFGADWGPRLPAPPNAAFLQKVNDYETANSVGITSVFQATGSGNSVATLKKLADAGKLTVHVNQALSAGGIRGVTDPAVIDKQIDGFDAIRAASSGYSNPASPGEITVDTVKVFCDGVPEFPGQTAAMLEPYRVNIGTPENPQWVPGELRGEDPSCEDAQLGYIELDRRRWNIHVHSLGDRATRASLNNFEAAMDANASWDRRDTLTHLQFVDDRDLARLGELGVVANFQAQLFQRDAWSTAGIEGYIAPDRMDNLYPAKDLIDGGAVASFGIDWPVTALKPWAAIEQAVTREGQVNAAQAIYPGTLNAGDGISLAQAYKASTIGVAYQMHLDDISGSIEVGKSADLIIVDRDPYNPPGGEAGSLAGAKADLTKAQDAAKAAMAQAAKSQEAKAAADAAVAEAVKGVKPAETKKTRAKARLKAAKVKLKAAKVKGRGEKRAKKGVKRAQKTLKRAKSALKVARQERGDAVAAAAAATAAAADAGNAATSADAAVVRAKRTLGERQQAWDTAHAEAIKDISNTQVLRTMLAGETVYRNAG